MQALAGLFVFESDRTSPRVAIPRPEVHLVARFGPSGALDLHAMGVRERVHRKVIPEGMRAVTARLRIDATRAMLGVPGAALSGRIVALADLWGEAATQRLCERLVAARDMHDAAGILERTLIERAARASSRTRERLAVDAASRLASTHVNAVADDLGVSERHLRRVFHETVGVSPKAYARLTRFHRALRAAHEDARASWTSIAASSGYYDQAHLIADFRAIAGVTPSALLRELRAVGSVG